MRSTRAKLFTYAPLVLFERVEHVKTMYKYNCCADTVLIAAEKKGEDFLQLSSVNKLIVVLGNRPPRPVDYEHENELTR